MTDLLLQFTDSEFKCLQRWLKDQREHYALAVAMNEKTESVLRLIVIDSFLEQIKAQE